MEQLDEDDSLTYSWQNINVVYKKKSSEIISLLQGVSGFARPGELLGILGASGAGKTTLLDVLTFRNAPPVEVDSGWREVNGCHVTSLEGLSSSYVQQHDLFLDGLTAREHLIFQASLRLPAELSMEKKEEKVDEIIQQMELSDYSSALTGTAGFDKGVKKKLSFACEMLSEPKLLFCDEPTSGLDSNWARTVVYQLKDLSMDGNRTIICTIHQPSSEVFEVFDRLIFMAEGRVAYFGGGGSEFISFLTSLGPEWTCPSQTLPADFFLERLAIKPGEEASCRDRVLKVCDKASEFSNLQMRQHQRHQALKNNQRLPLRQHYRAGRRSQLWALIWRTWYCSWRVPKPHVIRLCQTLVLALVLGLLGYGHKTDHQDGVLYLDRLLCFSIIHTTYSNYFASVMVFSGDLPYFWKDHLSGLYRPEVYFLSKVLVLSPFNAFTGLLFAVIPYFLLGFYPDVGVFCISCLVQMMSAVIGGLLGFWLSCLFDNPDLAVNYGPSLVLFPIVVTSGIFIAIKSLTAPFQILSQMSWLRHAFEALLINQWQHFDVIYGSEAFQTSCEDYVSTGIDVIRSYGFSEKNLVRDLILLAGYIILFYSLGSLSLVIKTTIKKRQKPPNAAQHLTMSFSISSHDLRDKYSVQSDTIPRNISVLTI